MRLFLKTRRKISPTGPEESQLFMSSSALVMAFPSKVTWRLLDIPNLQNRDQSQRSLQREEKYWSTKSQSRSKKPFDHLQPSDHSLPHTFLRISPESEFRPMLFEHHALTTPRLPITSFRWLNNMSAPWKVDTIRFWLYPCRSVWRLTHTNDRIPTGPENHTELSMPSDPSLVHMNSFPSGVNHKRWYPNSSWVNGLDSFLASLQVLDSSVAKRPEMFQYFPSEIF